MLANARCVSHAGRRRGVSLTARTRAGNVSSSAFSGKCNGNHRRGDRRPLPAGRRRQATSSAIPGGAVLYIYDALFKQDKIQHVLVRHEQAAVHAADGYARATGEVGVALVTSGPGVTNAVTGIATAYMDSIPMVIITGQVPTHAIGQDAFQECDTVGITRPCVKHNFLVKDVRDLALTMKKAFYIARPAGPARCVVDIPKDVSAAKTRVRLSRRRRDALVQPGDQGPRRPDQKAVQLLLEAEAADDLHRRRRDPGQRVATS